MCLERKSRILTRSWRSFCLALTRITPALSYFALLYTWVVLLKGTGRPVNSLFPEMWHHGREQNTLEEAVVCGGAGSWGPLFPHTKRGLTGDSALHLCFFWHQFSLAPQGAKYCLCGKQHRLNSFSSQVAATLLPYLLREKAKNIIVRFNFACSLLVWMAAAQEFRLPVASHGRSWWFPSHVGPWTVRNQTVF